MKWNQDILNIPCDFFMVFAATFLMILSLSTGLTLSTWCKIIRASFILNGNECYKPNKYWIGDFYTEYTQTNQHTKYMQRIRNFSLVIADPGVNFRWISFIIVLSVKWIQFFWNCLVYYLFGMMQRIWNQRLVCSSSFFSVDQIKFNILCHKNHIKAHLGANVNFEIFTRAND